MTQENHIFKPGSPAHTIWREEVRLRGCLHPHFELQFDDIKGNNWSVTKEGFDDRDKTLQIIYPHPVRVTPVPEFEEGEEIEVSYSYDFPDPTIAKFIHKTKEGYFIAENVQGIFGYIFARKITKPEKTREELVNELIDKVAVFIDESLLYTGQVRTPESKERAKKILLEISSLQEQLKHKS